jgi:hypothetical protein
MLAGICSPGEPATISAVAAAVTSAPVVGARLLWKHCLQSTGRPCVGLNGTVVSTPHSEHSVRVSVRDRPAAAGPVPVFNPTPERLDLHGLQRFGSFLNCLSKKNSCSPAVKMNSPPQSAQVNSRSRNSMPLLPSYGGEHPGGRSWLTPPRGLPLVKIVTFGFEGAQNCEFVETSRLPVNVGR